MGKTFAKRKEEVSALRLKLISLSEITSAVNHRKPRGNLNTRDQDGAMSTTTETCTMISIPTRTQMELSLVISALCTTPSSMSLLIDRQCTHTLLKQALKGSLLISR